MLRVKINYDKSQLNDDGKLRIKYQRKKDNAKHSGIGCELTFDDFKDLMVEAGLRSSDLGWTGRKYVLARYNDTGTYKKGNCRFITQHENLLEMKTSEKSRIASHNNMMKIHKTFPRELLNKLAKDGQQRSPYFIARHKRMLDRKAKIDPNRSGINNYRFGKHWITNGIIDKFWSDDKGPIPEGFRYGRTHANGSN